MRRWTEGLIKELFNFGEHSFVTASRCYPSLKLFPSLFLRCLYHKLPPQLPFSSFISLSDSYTASILFALTLNSVVFFIFYFLSSNCIFLQSRSLTQTWWKLVEVSNYWGLGWKQTDWGGKPWTHTPTLCVCAFMCVNTATLLML